MRRREIELRDAMAGAWSAARVSGGQFKQLVPIYAGRMGLAYQIMRGQRVQRAGRTIALTAVVATVAGAVVAIVAERLIAHRTKEIAAEEAATEPAPSEAAFTG